MPGRTKQKKTTKAKEAPEPLLNIIGILRKIDEKAIVLEAQDTRILNLKRSPTTKFYKNSDEVKDADLKPGDHLLIEATQDIEGFMSAVNVIFQKDGTARERESASEPVDISTQASEFDDEIPRLRRKDSPEKDSPEKETADAHPAPDVRQPASASEPPPQKPAAVITAQPPIIDDDDDGAPPRLKRGIPARRKPSRPQETASVRLPEHTPAVSAEPPVENKEPARTENPVIEKARAVAESFTETLPNYICQQFTARFVNTSHTTNWQALDVVSAEVVYEDGREGYRNLAINGKPTKKAMEEMSGSWSTGEFGTVLRDLFSLSTAAEFRFRKDSTMAGVPAQMFDFTVDRENSHWRIQVASQSIRPAYKGSVWIDKKNYRVLRIEMQARSLPEEFPLDKVESATDYEYVRLGSTAQFLLPVHAENLSCQRGTNICSRNAIDFRNYHKYSGESNIIFNK